MQNQLISYPIIEKDKEKGLTVYSVATEHGTFKVTPSIDNGSRILKVLVKNLRLPGTMTASGSTFELLCREDCLSTLNSHTAIADRVNTEISSIYPKLGKKQLWETFALEENDHKVAVLTEKIEAMKVRLSELYAERQKVSRRKK